MPNDLHQKTIADYNQIAEAFSQTRQYLWPDFKLLEKYLEKKLKVLDLGCGNGRLSKLIKEHQCDYLGIDNSAGQLREAKKNFPDEKFIWGDLTDIPLPDQSIDQIWCIAAFHHLEDFKTRQKALQEMQRILKPNGVIIMTNWNLFQKKYRRYLLKALFCRLNSLCKSQSAWNDVFIPWKNGTELITERYYHAFTPKELNKLFSKNNLKILESFYTKKGEKTNFWQSYNLCHVLQKEEPKII